MSSKRPLNRRSFVARIVGGMATGGGAINLVLGTQASATDNDPTDRASYPGIRRPDPTATGFTDRDPTDPANHGRPPRPRTGVTDHDPTDPADYGVRGSSSPETGVTDNDPTDPANHGPRNRNPPVNPPDRNGRPYTGITDRDPTDPANYGPANRGPSANPPDRNGRPYTGITDRDPTDPANYGPVNRGPSANPPDRNGRPYTGISDQDPGDPANYGIRGRTAPTTAPGPTRQAGYWRLSGPGSFDANNGNGPAFQVGETRPTPEGAGGTCTLLAKSLTSAEFLAISSRWGRHHVRYWWDQPPDIIRPGDSFSTRIGWDIGERWTNFSPSSIAWSRLEGLGEWYLRSLQYGYDPRTDLTNFTGFDSHTYQVDNNNPTRREFTTSVSCFGGWVKVTWIYVWV